MLYGLGRNGRALLRALSERAEFSGAAYIDDDPEVRAGGAIRIGKDGLGPSDLVVVTPDDGEGICRQLQTHDRVLTLSELALATRASA